MLYSFNLYDLFVLCFVQLLVASVLILGPGRELGTRFEWTGSRVTEVFLGAIVAIAVTAASCALAALLWGLPAAGLEAAAYPVTVFTVGIIILRPYCSVVGQIFYASFAAAGFAFTAYVALIAVDATNSFAEALTSTLLILLELAGIILWTSNVNYLTDVLGRRHHARALPVVDPSYQPKVSLHIPAYNEPPDLLIRTIQSVEAIDYPNFEIIVIDNNTPDPSVYGPVEEYCQDRDRVRFVHVAPLQGYKAGACNLALRQYTSPDAEIIGLIDADDIVVPHYLKETAPYFSDPNLGFVQTFEGNRDYEGSAYYSACVDSYQAFYLSVMSSRNERDSIPFVGTMGLFRREALERIGGWNEWCISEDTEASLRVMKAGWSGQYIPRCFGRGIVPPTFAGLNTQRHRWCFGAMQILRLHWRSLLPWDRSPDNHLTASQRRDYLIACLGWTRDLLMLAFASVLLMLAGLRLSGSGFALTPLSGAKSLLPLALILIATICMTWTLRHWTTLTGRRAILALIVSLSACWITAHACIVGLTRREGVFLRTAKSNPGRSRLRDGLRVVRWECLFAIALFTAAGILSAGARPPVLLIFLIAVQGLVYACAPIASIWNLRVRRVPAVEYRARHERIRERAGTRRHVAVGSVIGAVFGAVAIAVVLAVFAAPNPLTHDRAGARAHAVSAVAHESAREASPSAAGRIR